MIQTEENEPTKEYVDAFNDGYLTAKYRPKDAEKILSYQNDSELLIGLKDGIEQYSLEIEKIKNIAEEKTTVKYSQPSWLKDDRIEDIDKETDLNKEKGKDKGIDLEPDI